MRVFRKRSEQLALLTALRSGHPKFLAALIADSGRGRERGERYEFGSTFDALVQALRLMRLSKPFFALALYRLKTRSQALRIPVVPRLAHRWAMTSAQLCIGDPVIMEPGVYIPHGQVVIDGIVRGAPASRSSPRVTVGLKAGIMHGREHRAGCDDRDGRKGDRTRDDRSGCIHRRQCRSARRRASRRNRHRNTCARLMRRAPSGTKGADKPVS